MRRYLVLAAVLAACQQDPHGRCTSFADCQIGQECTSGVCTGFDTDHLPGSRCMRDGDCAAWATCAAEACVLTPGMCGTGADCAAWQACDAAHACVTAPGFCALEADCTAWQDCGADHRCALTAGMCGTSVDCAAWQACDAAHACVTAPGFCADGAGCEAWETCPAASHVCTVVAGRCNSTLDCQEWEACDGTNTCVLASGRCTPTDGCQPWQSCGTDHLCALTPGMCGTGADCASWDLCDGTYTCVHGPGYCGSDPDCATWQTCDTSVHACVTGVGFCTDAGGCAVWETCGTIDHLCAVAAGRCADATNCATWETCGTDYVCALSPGRCVTTQDCAPGLICDGAAHTCVDEPLAQTDLLIVGGFDGAWLGVGGFARLDSPTQPHFAIGWFDMGYIDPSGAFVYSATAPGHQGIFKFVPDALRWDTSFNAWTGPIDPLDNDPVLLTISAQCPSVTWSEFVMQAGTGALLFNCQSYYPPYRWVDESGTLRVTSHRILAWNADGYMLGQRYYYDVTNSDSVLDPAGTPTAIVGLPAGGIVAVRVHPSGFRVCYRTDTDPVVHQSWLIGTDGVATLEGTFADAPPATQPSDFWGEIKLDSDGTLYQADWVNNLIVRRPLVPGVSSVPYDGARPAGYNDNAAVPFNPYLTDGSAFVTSP